VRCPTTLPDEQERLRALAEYGLSAEQGLPSLDPIVQIAVKLFGVPVAAVNMIGSDHVFFAASEGIAECDLRREISFCAHAITQNDVLVVEDTKLDERFHDNPLVTGPEKIRFYAGVALRSPAGQPVGALCVVDSRPHDAFTDADRDRLKDLAKLVADKLELRRIEVASQGGRSRFQNIGISSPNPMICFDDSGVVTAINAAAQTLFGLNIDAGTSVRMTQVFPAWHESRIFSLLDPARARADAWDAFQETLTARRADGSQVPLEVAWSAWREGDKLAYGAVMRDITVQSREQEELRRLANHDAATGLPNRNLLQKRLLQEIEEDRPLSLILLGLNGFKDITDTLGENAGHQFVKTMSERLRALAGPEGFVARLAGDEFAILVAGSSDPLGAAQLGRDIVAEAAGPLVIDGQEVRVGGSCGIAMSPIHGRDPEELIGNASLALFQARREGAARCCFFIPALRMQAVARRMFDTELHRAVDQGELVLHYQPQVRLPDGALIGAEALIRWNHPERGLLAPAAFLPSLENSPLAARVGDWVIETACAQAASWRAELCPDFRMSVNLFAAQFRARDLRKVVAGAVSRNRLPPGSLELEITENIVLTDDDMFLPVFENLRQDGIKLAFDDFGTGFASLSLLKRYPLTHLKIDKSFVQAACASKGDRAIVEAITDLANRFDLGVIAEGVETWEQFELCRTIGCDEVQGYLTGRPMSAERFGETFRSEHSTIAQMEGCRASW